MACSKNKNIKMGMHSKMCCNLSNHLTNVKGPALAFLIIIISVVFVMPVQPVTAVPTSVDFDATNYGLGDTAYIEVSDDCTGLNPAVIEEVDVTVTATDTPPTITRDSITLTLAETGVATCTFGGWFSFPDSAIIFTNSSQIPRQSIVTMDINDPGFAGPASVTVTSTTDATGITLPLANVGPGEFTGSLFLGSSSIPARAIAVMPGDIVTIEYFGEKSTFLVGTNPYASVGALGAFFGDTITATAGAVTSLGSVIDLEIAGGGGGGGLVIRPSFVLDAILGGRGGPDHTPPSFTLSRSSVTQLSLPESILAYVLEADPFTPIMPLNDPSIHFPFSVNDNGFVLSQYANTIETQMVKTGQPVLFKLVLKDASGIAHVGLYTNVPGSGGEIQNSDTYIIYDKGNPVEITDPHGLFSDVILTTKEGAQYEFLYNITFAKPMKTSDMIFRVWDEKRNSADTKIFDAIEVTGEPIIDNTIQIETVNMVIPYFKDPIYALPVIDSHGNMIYYNSFGGLENKQAHPYNAPTIYPDHIGRAERYNDGFLDAIIAEDIKARTIAETLIGNTFKEPADRLVHERFIYPSNVGKLDRENIDALKDAMINEHVKATKYYSKVYHTNLIED